MVEVDDFYKCDKCGVSDYTNHLCRACKVSGMTHDEYINHTKTKEHAKVMSEAFLKRIYCNKCDLQCETQIQFDKHILSKKHLKEEEEEDE